MSEKSENEFLIVSKARVTNIEFTFDGESPLNVTKRKRRKAGPLSVHPDHEGEILQAALEAFKKRYPIELYQDTYDRIVKIAPSRD